MTTYVTTLTGNPTANKNQYLYLGLAETAVDVGFVVPENAKITVVTASQSGTADSNIRLRVNGAIVETLAITDGDHVFVVDVDVLQGDIISADNDNGNNLPNFSMNLSLVNAPPPLQPDPDGPQTVRDFYRVNLLGHYINGIVSAHGAKTLGDGATKRNTVARIEFIDDLIDYLINTRP